MNNRTRYSPILCRHCRRHHVGRPRGLCWHCYYEPGVRELYRSKNKYGIGIGRKDVPPPALPTLAIPGSPEKVAVLEQRAYDHTSLWHPQDATIVEQLVVPRIEIPRGAPAGHHRTVGLRSGVGQPPTIISVVRAVLADAEGPLRLREIVRRVQARSGRDVSLNSVNTSVRRIQKEARVITSASS